MGNANYMASAKKSSSKYTMVVSVIASVLLMMAVLAGGMAFMQPEQFATALSPKITSAFQIREAIDGTDYDSNAPIVSAASIIVDAVQEAAPEMIDENGKIIASPIAEPITATMQAPVVSSDNASSPSIPSIASTRSFSTVVSELCAQNGGESLSAKWYRDHLDNPGVMAIYDALERGFRNYSAKVDFPLACAPQTAKDIYHYVLTDNDDIFWLSPEYDMWKDGAGNACAISPIYKYDENTKNDLAARIDARANQAVAETAGASNQYDRAVAIANWLAFNTSASSNLAPCQDIQSVFIDGRSVCAGYSHAFAYICKKVGITATCITGTASNGRENGGHIWNALVIAGSICYADVFWGDTGNSFDMNNMGISYNTISANHWADSGCAPRTSTNRFEYTSIMARV